jgi:hypothetical protein
VRKGRWVKLYVREEGSFAQLPLYVRALGAELLKICDSTGRIALRGKAPWDAVAFQLGADLSDRRLLKKHIPLLIADGYLAVIGGDLLVRNFAAAQDRHEREPAPTETPVERETNASDARGERETDATETRVEHERDTRSESSPQNPPPNGPLEESREEKRREEEKSGEGGLPLTRTSEPDSLAARRRTLRGVWDRHRALYAALQADGIGKDARPLRLMSEGERELADRLIEHKGDLDSFRADCEHVLATRRSQAIARGDLDWFGSSIWRRDQFLDAMSRTPESYRKPPKARGSPTARNFQVTGDEPYKNGDVDL